MENLNIEKNLLLELEMSKYKLFDIYSSIELTNTGFLSISLEIVSWLAIISGLIVITSNNPIISVLFLISLFINISIYLILLGIPFIGLLYVIVYIGAVTILFLYIIMLLDIKISEITLRRNNLNNLPLGVILVIGLSYPVLSIISKLNNWDKWDKCNIIPKFLLDEKGNNLSYFEDKVYKLDYHGWEEILTNYSNITSLGNIMYSTHLTIFIIISLILLLAIIGSISLTLRR